jgi:hypothetical protein
MTPGLGILCSIHLSYGGTVFFQVVSTSPLPYQSGDVSNMSLRQPDFSQGGKLFAAVAAPAAPTRIGLLSQSPRFCLYDSLLLFQQGELANLLANASWNPLRL